MAFPPDGPDTEEDDARKGDAGKAESGTARAGAGERGQRAAPSAVGRGSIALSTLSVLVAGLALWFVLFVVFFSALQEHGSQARLYDRFRAQLANETAPFGAPIRAGDPVALLSSARAGLHNVVVVEGTTAKQLRDGPGHEAGTPLPGQVGTALVAGRALAYGGPFARISSLRPGDTINATTAQGAFTYRVEDTRHPGERGPTPLSAGQGRLTLVTASGGWLGRLTPSHALYVDAIMVKGQAQPVPAPLPAVSRAAEPMQGDSSAAVPLIFWLQGLLAVGALVALAWWRWGRWQTWLVGLPVVLAVSWGVSDTLVRFLPNLF